MCHVYIQVGRLQSICVSALSDIYLQLTFTGGYFAVLQHLMKVF